MCLHYFLVSRLLNVQQEHVEQIDDNALGREVVAGWRYSTAERKWLSSFLVDTRSSLRQVERYNNQRVYSREDLSLPPNLERSSRRIRADVIFTRRVNACTLPMYAVERVRTFIRRDWSKWVAPCKLRNRSCITPRRCAS